MIAALYVAANGCYFGIDDVDPYDEARDARTYAGPHAVIAHPPCQTWGSMARSGMTLRPLGDDDGNFAFALAAVRRWGGVLEHPAESSAWGAHSLARPYARGWHSADLVGGWTCRVEQGHYGHRARKATWLYAVRCDLPSLVWGDSVTETDCDHLSRKARMATPEPFKQLLLSMARSVSSSLTPTPPVTASADDVASMAMDPEVTP